MPKGTDAGKPTHTFTPLAVTAETGKKVKSGWKSTEFWTVGVLPQVLLLLQMFGVFDAQSVKEISQSIASVSHTSMTLYASAGAAFYAISRGLAKMKG